MINGENCFDSPIKNDKVTYEILEKFVLVLVMIIPVVLY